VLLGLTDSARLGSHITNVFGEAAGAGRRRSDRRAATAAMAHSFPAADSYAEPAEAPHQSLQHRNGQ